MFEIICCIFVLSFLFGVIYPLGTILFYPIYKFFGGRDSFKKYIKNM